MQDIVSEFSKLRVLVVEDEAIISFMIEDMLSELGVRDVLLVNSVPKALSLLENSIPDLAILDMNLGGQPVDPVARRLAASGVPFAFASGYGRSGLSAEWSDRPVIQKPFDLTGLERGMRACLASERSK